MTMTSVPATRGRHAAPVGEPELDVEMERLVEVGGVPSGLPAGLGDNQGTAVRGSHRSAEGQADATTTVASHLPWKLLLTGALALLVVLALAFVAIDAMAASWGVGARIS